MPGYRYVEREGGGCQGTGMLREGVRGMPGYRYVEGGWEGDARVQVC